MSRSGSIRRRRGGPGLRRLFLKQLEGRALLATIVVTGTGDTIAVDGLVTLREAITSANNNADLNADVVAVGAYGTDTINFNIPGAGVHTISPTSALPTITDPVIIDGYTQPGASPNTLSTGYNGTLLIELSGVNAGAASALTITAGNSTVRGLMITRFGDDGIRLETAGGNLIEGNTIGTDTNAPPNLTSFLGNGDDGIEIVGTANNTIGGSTPQARNIISGNGLIAGDNDGVYVVGPTATGNRIEGNYIGTNADGTASTGNREDAIDLDVAVGNLILRNVLSSNGNGLALHEARPATSSRAT